MKKHFFDPGLYMDALRQLRFLGLAGVILLSLEAVLIPLGMFISMRRLHEAGGGSSLQTMISLEMHPLLLLCFCVLAPLMMLYLFQFLNKRSASDFYHAIPNSRISLFISFFMAVMTWLTLAAVVSTLLSALGFLLLSHYVSFSLLSLVIYLFNTLAACLYVCGAMAVAMCVTGTLFTNVLVSMLILFMPRLLLAVFCSTLQGLLPVISSLYFIPPMDSQYNVVTNMLLGLFNGNADMSFTFAAGGVYTLSIGVLYTGLAAWLFHRRKSETAGKSAPNRAVQTVYRLLLAMLVCLFPCVFIVNILINREPVYSEDIFLIFVFYLGALLVYFLYELFTTRKWRNVLRSIPALGILLLMNAAFIGGVAIAYYSTLGIQPKEEEIEAVRLIDRSTDEYFSAKTASVRHTSPTIRNIIASRLQYTLDLVRDSPHQFYAAQSDSSMVTQQVAIYLPGRTLYRNILLTSREVSELAAELAKSETFQDAYLRLPDHPVVTVNGLTQPQAADVYATLREEVAHLDFTVWYRYLQGQTSGSDVVTGSQEYRYGSEDFFPASVNFSGGVGIRQYATSIPLGSLLPKTCSLYMRYINQSGGDVLGRLEAGNWSGGESLHIMGLRFMDGTKHPRSFSRQYSGDMLLMLGDQLKDLAAQLKGQNAAEPDMTRPLYFLTLSTGDGNAARLYINAPDTTLPDFLRQYGK